eukprot:GSA120T00000063001.1
MLEQAGNKITTDGSKDKDQHQGLLREDENENEDGYGASLPSDYLEGRPCSLEQKKSAHSNTGRVLGVEAAACSATSSSALEPPLPDSSLTTPQHDVGEIENSQHARTRTNLQSLNNSTIDFDKDTLPHPLLLAIAPRVKRVLRKAVAQDLALFCNAYAKLQIRCLPVFKWLSAEIPHKLTFFEPQHLAMVASAFANLQIPDRLLMGEIRTEILQRRPEDFEMSQIVILASAYAKVKGNFYAQKEIMLMRTRNSLLRLNKLGSVGRHNSQGLGH